MLLQLERVVLPDQNGPCEARPGEAVRAAVRSDEMKLVVVVLVVGLTFASIGTDARPQIQSKNAHDYYKGLYVAGGLQQYSQYACFFDDDVASIRDFFFTVIFSDEMLAELKSTPLGTEMLKLLPKQDQEFIRKRSAGIYRYNKGIFLNGVVMYKDDLSSWVKISNDGKGRERFWFQRQTLRFAWIFEKPKALPPAFGHCERIPTDIKQNGENE